MSCGTLESDEGFKVHVGGKQRTLLLCSRGSRLCRTRRYDAATFRKPAEMHFWSKHQISNS